MSITKRQEQILELLHENRSLSVERLSQLTYTSPSSIRRDLTSLQNAGFLRRSHGAASILDESVQPASLNSRMNINMTGKRRIAKKAAVLLRDNCSVMLDSSSTAGFLIPHIAKRSNITLFTNNMITAITAINYGIETHCIGGSSVNRSAALSGAQAYRTVLEIHPDLLYFSSHSLDQSGLISDPTQEENYMRMLMLQNARQKVFLCDSEKFGRKSLYALTTVDQVDACVFDEAWPELKAACRVL